MKILLVEDDKSIAHAVALVLTKQHYLVDIAADGQDGWELTQACDYDLIVLDVMLPKLDGISLCVQLRREGYQKPILLLTARDSGTDKVMGLNAGADDYVVKPFDFAELTARIRALLRRTNSPLALVLELGKLRLDPNTCEVTYGNQILHVTPTEYSVLELFLRNQQRVFSRSAIIDHLWSLDDPPAEDTIKSYIKSLRQKLKAAGAPKDLIETVYGLGYRLKYQPEEEKCQIQPIEPELSHAQQKTLLAVADLLEDFRKRVRDRLSVLDQAAIALKEGKLSDQLRLAAEQEAHKLAGSLGSFGFAAGSQLAQEIEDILQATTSLNQTESLPLCKLVMALHHEIEQSSTKPIYVKQVSSDWFPKVLIVSNDTQLIEQLVLEASTRKILIETAPNIATAKSEISSQNPDIVLLDFCFAEGEEDCLSLLTDLSHQIPPVPVMVFTNQNSLTARLEVARKGGCAFLLKSAPPEKVVDSVMQVWQRFHATDARVMIVDDDPQVLNFIQNLLEPQGIKLATLEDPRQFWDTLTEFCPNLLILDLKMPQINGIELCQVVRNDPLWSKLSVLFLTAYAHEDTLDKIFAAGADDCVSKPIEGHKLLTRILSCLQRSRLPR
ncbi:response regulator [Aetokthonos hydrillicola Thurmond2011]|jgi:DNA-binding response OmpR family regulator/HPt (histidine-containing phosphotransfer) domain-containing protein|uniref:Response regulator n=1 Tax=Aetokthonos hydrillicola Thurmond2011 TaxID=2712845 RepID=A0AAP5IA49_9CYAN|nr:response regulator [Aetokthonos hydrillicola]MBO3461590.1 response regulator [Aetokthonos hydrillicola CCALA 1050]MBW4586108.1 response regulator [Aetokthonos hydrillicola CCALA 1050]MDR9897715.1 response regulator [Aetokthonos hydrillicola Thurmond2011]